MKQLKTDAVMRKQLQRVAAIDGDTVVRAKAQFLACQEAGGTQITAPLNREKYNAELEARLAKYAPGCGLRTHVCGTNGGTLPCGSTITWPSGEKEQCFCPNCQNQLDIDKLKLRPEVVILSEKLFRLIALSYADPYKADLSVANDLVDALRHMLGKPTLHFSHITNAYKCSESHVDYTARMALYCAELVLKP